MDAALALARSGLGRTAPNPSVGCIIVNSGEIVGAARTADRGRPHAETQALAIAGQAASGACAYVTLEPCAHVGQTPPCSEALIAAGIARCVVALVDPDPRTSGQGLARLEAAGVEVVSGIRETEARAINSGFLYRLKTGQALAIIDDNPVGYDLAVETFEQDDPAAALKTLAEAGVLRVRLVPNSPAAKAAQAAGLTAPHYP